MTLLSFAVDLLSFLSFRYTTINRGRPSTTTEDSVQASSEDSEEKEEEDEEEDFRRPSSTTPRAGLPQYVNIRRARPSTTTEPEPTIRYVSKYVVAPLCRILHDHRYRTYEFVD